MAGYQGRLGPGDDPSQRIGSAIYALVAQELANPKNPTVLLSHDGFLRSDITCFAPPENQFTVLGAGFQPGDLVTVTAIGGASDGGDADILTAVADSSRAFLVQGASTSSPAIPCSGGGPCTVTARGDKGSVSSQPVFVITPTPTPSPTPIPTPVPGVVTVAENQVRWIKDNGDDITSIEPDSTAVFFIRDDALDTAKSGTAVFSGIPANSKFFDIPNGAAAPAAPGTTTGVTRVLTAPGYDTTTPSNTPLQGNPTVKIGGVANFVVGSNANARTFTLLVAANATTTATFNWRVPDVWGGQQTATRRARVTSTSDPAGEWITISEVNSIGNSTPHATSKLFRGQVVLSSNAATQGTYQDGVWVQVWGTVTVIYVDSNGSTVDTDTLAVVLP